VYRDGQAEWELKALVKKRTTGRGTEKETEYLGRWKGCGPEWDQWFKLPELANAQQLVEDFENQQARSDSAKEAAEKARDKEKGKRRSRKVRKG
jgi:hypothetical protein